MRQIPLRHGPALMLAALLAVATPAQAQMPQVLAFGDSLTEGYGLTTRQGLVPVLEDWLARHGTPATISNAGLSGDTTYGGRVRIGWSLRRFGGDAVIVELGGNDMLMGFSPEKAEANLDAILTQAGASGRPVLLVGIQAPQGPSEWRNAWARIWPRLAQRHDAYLLPDLYAPLAAAPKSVRPALLQADGVHPSAKGVRLIVEALGPCVQALITHGPACRIGAH